MTLWQWDAESKGWRARTLEAGAAFTAGPGVALVPLPSGRCALLSTGEVTVNGSPVLPLRILDDRDEIGVGGVSAQRMYVSVDSPAAPDAFPGGEAFCGRCKGPMRAGERAVRCPRCRMWHHQTDALGCWTYATTCSGCDQPVAGEGWQPEPLTPRDPERLA